MKCSDCGQEIAENEEYYCTANDETICEHCMDTDYFICEHCGRICHINDMTTVESRSENTLYWCDDCDRWYDLNYIDSYETADDRIICEYCRDSNYDRCVNCDALIHCDDICQFDDDDEVYCHDCYMQEMDARNSEAFCSVQGYHVRPTIEYYYGKDEVRTEPFKGFGIELEVDDGKIDRNDMVEELHEIVGDHIYYNRDGSLCDNGFEIITQPHTEQALYEINWKEVLSKLVRNGFTSHNNGNCGLHMHVSRAYFGDTEAEQTECIAKIIASDTERYFNNYNYGEHDQRYKCVNLTNSNTIEIRVMRGTLKLSTFLATLDFIITIAKNSNNITWDNVDDISAWFQGMKSETLDYLTSRQAFIANVEKYPFVVNDIEDAINVKTDEIETIRNKLKEINK